MARDTRRNPRQLWPANLVAVPVVFACITLWDGAGYALGPASWARSPSLTSFDHWPGGIRTYGALCLLVSLTITLGLTRHNLQRTRLGLTGAMVVYLLLTASVLASWAEQGIHVWGGPSKGVGLSALAFCILRRVPNQAGDGE